jgi:alpha-L-fucosidase
MEIVKLLRHGLRGYFDGHGPIKDTHITEGISIMPSVLKRCTLDRRTLQANGRANKWLQSALHHWLQRHESLSLENMEEFLAEVEKLNSTKSLEYDLIRWGNPVKNVKQGYVYFDELSSTLNEYLDIRVHRSTEDMPDRERRGVVRVSMHVTKIVEYPPNLPTGLEADEQEQIQS